ncbi:pentapeptide repeat-containing protein [Gloeothece verrucosa]|uniref:Pentapeptide repeat protein n=1 Tax=Gloeothece verrucosa (strain PCC 7822) TaxID=497965 RepID=E0UF05_GLOV7|nr:pentapeptide repeat-containing protein [Gloeothece verrucosa]ADN14257.1 pentapeptide repeat protein [Gloeothece verrucosa PCC 7822]
MQFITTETLDTPGTTGEQIVWQTIQEAFKDRNCIAYWRYPIFSKSGKFRKEPDILIIDQELGIIIIEVKSITINQIININGHQWQYQNYYISSNSPYQQAENQLFALLEYTHQEPALKNQITGRVLIALPLITEQQWQEKNYHKLPTSPPIIFKNHLLQAVFIGGQIEKTLPLTSGANLTQNQWKLLLSILAGNPVHCQPNHQVLSQPESRGKLLQKLRSHISEFDIQQETISKQIPPGCQRIRGIAGSGKTVLLTQKAAIMHLKHPDWKIALVFFSRSLYHPIREQIDKWLEYFSNNEQKYDPKNRNLLILHAWGSRQQPGLYSTLCKYAGVAPLTVQNTSSQQPNEALAEACSQLLKETAIPQIFDAILIDEGQDLIVDNYKFEDKQPFYWMAYQALRSADPLHPQQKRLIWAYDEAQSLDSLKIPTASELFGEKLGHLVTGKYPNNIKKSEIMRRTYRTPHPIITAAHGISMGLLRTGGMLTGMTRKAEWEAIGYQVEGKFIPGQKITLKRPRENSPNPIPELWQGSIIDFQIHASRSSEISSLASQIIHNFRYEGLRPCREILVIVLGTFYEAMRLETHIATFLMRQGIDIFIPGSSDSNILKPEPDQRNPNQFWCEGAVTISRLHRAKGHEADLVYIVGLDQVAKDESNIYLRNQLFVALTRARAWVKISGIGDYVMYDEMRRVIGSGDTFSFTFTRPPKREINVTDAGELLKRYALGGRNFRNADLQEAQLSGICLKGANLIGANLRGANLENAQLDHIKLIAADLSYTNLKGASLRKAKLMGAILEGANLQNTDLTEADLTNTDLNNVKLS